MNNKSNFDNLGQFYISMADQAAPVIRQGMQDWFKVCKKLWSEGLKVQSQMLGQISGTKELINISDQAKEFGEKVMEIQLKLSTDMFDSAVTGIKKFSEKK